MRLKLRITDLAKVPGWTKDPSMCEDLLQGQYKTCMLRTIGDSKAIFTLQVKVAQFFFNWIRHFDMCPKSDTYSI